jgi:DNA-binding transcriptional LysR family regulator
MDLVEEGIDVVVRIGQLPGSGLIALPVDAPCAVSDTAFETPPATRQIDH